MKIILKALLLILRTYVCVLQDSHIYTRNSSKKYFVVAPQCDLDHEKIVRQLVPILRPYTNTIVFPPAASCVPQERSNAIEWSRPVDGANRIIAVVPIRKGGNQVSQSRTG